jgi:thiol-disulfide isomerase/thioredoxin
MIRTVAALAVAATLVQSDFAANSYKGKAPPELLTEAGQWMNPPPALKLADLKGKVVWLEFGFIKCSGCRKMKPFLAKWHKEFAEKGLIIIDVYDGSQDTLEDVKKEVADGSFTFPVLWDKEGRMVSTYNVQAMPASYLIGPDGVVAWEGHPAPYKQKDVDKLEALIKTELEKVKK